MPASLTIFAAERLVYIDAFLAFLVLAWLLLHRARPSVLRWGITVAILLVLSFIFAKIGAHFYNDPRPFTTDHVKPLLSHSPDNGFPSDHALLAAAIVAAVGLIDLWLALPFVVLAVLVDWARVGSGIHHFGDVIGSSLFVALALGIALLIAPPIFRLLAPRLPQTWLETAPPVRDEVPAVSRERRGG